MIDSMINNYIMENGAKEEEEDEKERRILCKGRLETIRDIHHVSVGRYR